jgi:hypothetical protein
MPRSIPTVALAALLPGAVGAESPSMEERFRRLEARQVGMERELREKDRRVGHGFQVQGATMQPPKTLQAHVAGFSVFGEHGEPWGTSVGLNWHPFEIPSFRLSGQALSLEDSPAGYASVPFARGGGGWVYGLDVELLF